MRKLCFFISFISLFFFEISSGLAYEDNFEKRLNLWPVIFYSKNKKQDIKRLEVFGPIFNEYQFLKEKEFSIRPIFSSVVNPSETRVYFISPLGFYKSNYKMSSLKFIPIIRKTWYKTEKSKRSKDWEFFPFFAGITSNNETYGGFFPFYGKFKNRLGAKEITFFLWPIYSKTQYQEYTSQNFFWPFIKIMKSKKNNYSGFKIWPIYGHFKENFKERSFIFWPFYIKRKDNFSQELIIFPFYIKENTDAYDRFIILWPFFQKVYAKKFYYKQIDFPWPFYRSLEGKDIEGMRLWPFYGYVKRKNSSDSFLLWPLYFYKTDTICKGKNSYKKREHRFLVLSKYVYTQKINKNAITTKKEFRFWPFLYDYQLNNNSGCLEYWYFPAILPLYNEGLERNYGPFLKLIEYYKKNDYSFLKLLWGLYRYEKYKTRSVNEIAFIFREIKDKKTNYIEFLEGFFGIGKIQGKPVLKIFYYKINI